MLLVRVQPGEPKKVQHSQKPLYYIVVQRLLRLSGCSEIVSDVGAIPCGRLQGDAPTITGFGCENSSGTPFFLNVYYTIAKQLTNGVTS